MIGPTDVTAKIVRPVSVLPPGIHGWWWPGVSGWGDPSAEIAKAVEQGFCGLIPQNGLDTSFCEQHGDAIRAAGLFTVCGIGMDGDSSGAPECSAAIIRGLDAAGAVMLDFEKPRKWETAAGRAMAQSIVDAVLQARPDAVGRVTDCPWWAPLYYVTREPGGSAVKHATHPGAPTAIFGKLCAYDRYVQAYGAAKLGGHGEPDEPLQNANGRSTRMLEWARDPSQYAAIAKAASVNEWSIRPAFEMYRRTVPDHVTSMTREPTVCLWDRQEADARCVAGLLAVKALRSKGFDGEFGVASFQKSAGLTQDGVCGEKTCGALGVAWPG